MLKPKERLRFNCKSYNPIRPPPYSSPFMVEEQTKEKRKNETTRKEGSREILLLDRSRLHRRSRLFVVLALLPRPPSALQSPPPPAALSPRETSLSWRPGSSPMALPVTTIRSRSIIGHMSDTWICDWMNGWIVLNSCCSCRGYKPFSFISRQ